MKCDDYFYVLFCTENAQFLMPNGETTQRLLEAERFETIKEAKEEMQILDEPKDFIIFKVKTEYWLKRA